MATAAWRTLMTGVAVLVLIDPWTTAAAQQPRTRPLSEQELVDAMVGSCIQSSRGCNSENMIKMIKAALAEGKQFNMIAVEDLPDDWTVVSPVGLGGGGAWEHVIERTKKQNLPMISWDQTHQRAVDALSKYIGKKFNAILRAESAEATGQALLRAAAMGLPIVDACLSDRARPTIQHQVPFTHGIPASPASLVTRWGDTILIDAVDDYRTEDLGRAVGVSSGGGAGLAMNPMSGKDVKRGVIRGSLRQAILWGRTVREARAQGADPVAALLKVAGGVKLFQGIVTKSDPKGFLGHSYFDVELQGVNEYAGRRYKVFVQNENIVTWLDDKPDATVPDFICNLDPTTAHAIFGGGLGGYPLKREIVILGIPASKMWRTPEGIELFGPRAFGFDFDYVPVEEVYKRR